MYSSIHMQYTRFDQESSQNVLPHRFVDRYNSVPDLFALVVNVEVQVAAPRIETAIERDGFHLADEEAFLDLVGPSRKKKRRERRKVRTHNKNQTIRATREAPRHERSVGARRERATYSHPQTQRGGIFFTNLADRVKNYAKPQIKIHTLNGGNIDEKPGSKNKVKMPCMARTSSRKRAEFLLRLYIGGLHRPLFQTKTTYPPPRFQKSRCETQHHMYGGWKKKSKSYNRYCLYMGSVTRIQQRLSSAAAPRSHTAFR